MSLIEFKNLPDTSTPITAENLNNNFSELTPVLLYSGGSQNVTLSDDISNYQYIEITFGNDWLYTGTLKIPGESTYICLRSQNGWGGALGMNDDIGYFSVRGNTITPGDVNRSRHIEYNSDGTFSVSRENNVYIKMVIGYK